MSRARQQAMWLCMMMGACSRNAGSPQPRLPDREDPSAPADSVETAQTAQLPAGSWESWHVNGTEQWLLFRESPKPIGVLLFVHGGPGMPMSVLSSAFDAPYLQHFHIAHWDQRGAGRSSLPLPSAADLTVATYVRDAAVVADGLRARWPELPLVVAGHSWGSIVAAELAAEHPEQVDHLVLMGTVVDVPAMQQLQFETLVARGVPPQSLGSPPWDTLAKIVPVTQAIAAAGGSLGSLAPEFDTMIEASVDYTDDDRKAMGQGSGHTIEGLWPVVAGWSAPSANARFEMPVTFVHGAKDLSTPLSLVADYHARIDAKGGKAMFVRPDAAHFVMWEDNAAVARILRERVVGHGRR